MMFFCNIPTRARLWWHALTHFHQSVHLFGTDKNNNPVRADFCWTCADRDGGIDLTKVMGR